MKNDPQDKDLKAALTAWRDLEPAPGFEDRVWRRLQAAPAAQPTFIGWLRETLRQEPAWVPALSALAGVLVGIAALSPSQPHPQQLASLQILGADSLSGNYVRLAAGEQP